jgi:DNA-binding transcriptional ArsR family regulator
MLETLISSKTRIKLLVRLFLNPGNSAYLRELAEDFGESTNAVRMELNRFEEAGMLESETSGNKKIFRANAQHPLFSHIHQLLLRYVGVDQAIEIILKRMGALEKVFLSGDYAAGKDSGIIDLLFVGNVDRNYLTKLVLKAENLIHKKIKYLVYSAEEWKTQALVLENKALLLWEKTA